MMHAKARARHEDRLRRSDRSHMDALLDLYGDSLLRATEWDADQWGFDPDRWMCAERRELASRGGAAYPREAV